MLARFLSLFKKPILKKENNSFDFITYTKVSKPLNVNTKQTDSKKKGELKKSHGNKLLILIAIKTGEKSCSTNKHVKQKLS